MNSYKCLKLASFYIQRMVSSTNVRIIGVQKEPGPAGYEVI